ncbi:hypothetical protein B296_00035611 [Ensete ventricosum]|uniref:Secreted protein n=1 Tax=Ensete ventricosum TaxID=4639 RepID=A0A426Y0T6_ENSVE|nr:hypothetical protein B296_00035611 [Ensete ventricosum]
MSLLPLLLTMPSYLFTTPVVLTTDFPRRVGHVDEPIVQGREDVAARSTSAISFFPPWKTFSRCLIRVLKMRSFAELPACGDVGLVPSGGSGTDRTERSSCEELAGLHIWELIRPSRGSGVDPTEQGLGN